MFKSVKSSRNYEQIVEQIEKLILEGQLQVGDRFPSERDLAAQFEVSRVVIREAIRHLEARGIVKVRQGSGTYVGAIPGTTVARPLTLFLKLDKASFLDLLIVRQPLEVTAARLAAERATGEDIARLRACVADLSDVARRGLNIQENYFKYNDHETRFHQLIAQASHNAPLDAFLDAVVSVVMSSRFEIIKAAGDFDLFFRRHGIERIHDDHVAIAEAIYAHRPDEAARLMDEHLSRSFHYYATMENVRDLLQTPAALSGLSSDPVERTGT